VQKFCTIADYWLFMKCHLLISVLALSCFAEFEATI